MITRDYTTKELVNNFFDKEIKKWIKEKQSFEEHYKKTKSVISKEASYDVTRIIDEIIAHKKRALDAVKEYDNGN